MNIVYNRDTYVSGHTTYVKPYWDLDEMFL